MVLRVLGFLLGDSLEIPQTSPLAACQAPLLNGLDTMTDAQHYLSWRAEAVVTRPAKAYYDLSMSQSLKQMGEVGDAVEAYLAQSGTPHQSLQFSNWDLQSLMKPDADWTKMVEMQLAKVRAINALGGPRMMIVWSGTCKH